MCTRRSEREDSRRDSQMRSRAMPCDRRAPLPSDVRISWAKRDERVTSRRCVTKMRRTLVSTWFLRILRSRHRPLRGSRSRSTKGTSHRSSGSERHPRAPGPRSPTRSCASPSTQSREPRFARACARHATTRAGSAVGPTERRSKNQTNRREARKKNSTVSRGASAATSRADARGRAGAHARGGRARVEGGDARVRTRCPGALRDGRRGRGRR